MTRCDGAVLENEATGARAPSGRQRARGRGGAERRRSSASDVWWGGSRNVLDDCFGNDPPYWVGRRDVVNAMEPYSVSHGHKKERAKKT